MQVRILVERPGMARGAVVDLPPARAKELLNRGEAEPVARTETDRAERRG